MVIFKFYLKICKSFLFSTSSGILTFGLFFRLTTCKFFRFTKSSGSLFRFGLLGNDKKPFFKSIIEKNSEYPILEGILATTVQPFISNVLVQVFRGEDRDCKNNTKLGELHLKITNLSKDVVSIGVIFDLGQDGILHFYCVELPINIGEDRIVDIDDTKKLIEKGLVQFKKTKITVID